MNKEQWKKFLIDKIYLFLIIFLLLVILMLAIDAQSYQNACNEFWVNQFKTLNCGHFGGQSYNFTIPYDITGVLNASN